MSVPRNLPGFVWDPERNRYFPASSNPPPPLAPPAQITIPIRVRKQRSFWQRIHQGNSQHVAYFRDPNRHNVLGHHYAETTSFKEQRVPIFGAIKNFISTTTDLGQNYCLIGDNLGWIYSFQCTEDDRIRRPWVVETCLGIDTQVSSLNVCESYFLATSFGPTSNIRIQKLDPPNPSFILRVKQCHDIRCADFSNTDQIILGAQQRAIYITNIFDTPQTRVLKTNSDVFSVARQQTLVYLGTRNGSIQRFDLRTPERQASRGLFSNKLKSSVLHMQLINDMYFLSSYMNGQILMHDIRFPFSNTPLLQFTGQVNTHTPHLGITTDPFNDFLFAGGQDCRIRAWSLQNGDPILPTNTNLLATNPSFSDSTDASPMSGNPLLRIFDEPVQTMQITEESMGMCLWVGCDEKLCQFGLGRRGHGEQSWQLWGDTRVNSGSPLATEEFRG